MRYMFVKCSCGLKKCMHVNNAASGEAPTRGSVGVAAPKSVGTITHCWRMPPTAFLPCSYTCQARCSSLYGLLAWVKTSCSPCARLGYARRYASHSAAMNLNPCSSSGWINVLDGIPRGASHALEAAREMRGCQLAGAHAALDTNLLASQWLSDCCKVRLHQ